MHEFGASAIEAIRSACLEPDIEKHFNSDRQFLPAACAKHRVPSSYPKNNPTQDAKCGVATKGRGKGKGKTSAAHGKSSATHACEKKTVGQNFTGDFDELDFPPPGSQPLAPFVNNVSDNEELTTVDSSDDALEVARVFPIAAHAIADMLCRNPRRRGCGHNRHYKDSSSPKTNDDELDPYDTVVVTKEKKKAMIAQNPPTYVILKCPDNWQDIEYPFWPQKCTGCNRAFADQLYKPPLNLILRFRTIRTYIKGGHRWRSDGPQNAYFPAIDLGCISNIPELENVKVDDLYIEQSAYKALTQEQKNILKKHKHWNAVRRN